MKKKIIYPFVALLWVLMPFVRAYAQNEAPGKPQSKPVALTGATIHTGNGQTITDGVIVFDKGVITAVGDAATVYDKNNTEVVNLSGKHIFPGTIAMSTTLGIQEIASVRATLDFAEVGDINPHVRSLIAYSTDSEVIPTVRSSGVLVAQSVPQGGLFSGTSSVFNLDGWNWEDAVLKKDDGVWLNWPPFLARSVNRADFSVTIKRNEGRQAVIDLIKSTLTAAKAYHATQNNSPVNLRLEALGGLFEGTQNLYIRAHYAKDIIESVRLLKDLGVKNVVICGGEEAYKVAAFLAEEKVPVVLNELHRLPSKADDDVYLPYKIPGILHKAGVIVALSYGSEWWRVRNLNYQAGTASGFSNVPAEEALKFITLNPAKILGIEKQVGTLEKGKMATLIVTEGDAMDMRFNKVESAYIKGAVVNLDDKQHKLYTKYKEKYGQE